MQKTHKSTQVAYKERQAKKEKRKQKVLSSSTTTQTIYEINHMCTTSTYINLDPYKEII